MVFGWSAISGWNRPSTLRRSKTTWSRARTAFSFLPEVILSVRSAVRLMVNRGEIDPDDLGLGETVFGVKSDIGSLVNISRRDSEPTSRMQRLRVQRDDLKQLRLDKIIRRIDGNHRLHMAEQLTEDPNTPTKYLAPFCMVLLGPTDN